MKYLRKFNEGISHAKINDFIQRANDIINPIEDFEKGDEPSRVDLLSELGDLYNDLDMTREELEMAISSRRVSDVEGLLKIILDEVINEKTDSVVRNQNTPIEKVEVYCQAYDAGDGYVGSKWFMTEKEAWDDVEKGEPLVIRVETYVGSNVYIAAKNKTRAR
jgi:hypothetical protein